MVQQSIFDFLYEKHKITKPIRLIELFAGYGSQALAMKYLGANFERYKVVEFDKYAIQSYNEIHETSFPALDITKINASDLGIVDKDKYEYIMFYSFPCTDLSLAGQRKGMAKGSGTRSGLLWEVERLLNELHSGGYATSIDNGECPSSIMRRFQRLAILFRIERLFQLYTNIKCKRLWNTTK